MVEQLKHWSAMARLTSTKESVLSADQLDEIAAYIGALQQKLDAMAAENAAREIMVNDAIHAAIALTSAGVDVNNYGDSILRLHEWGSLPDYCIAVYMDCIHGAVDENKLLDFGYIKGPFQNVEDDVTFEKEDAA